VDARPVARNVMNVQERELASVLRSRRFWFARDGYPATASSGHPHAGHRNPRGFRFALVLQVGAVVPSVSGSLRQDPGIGLAPADAPLQSHGHCRSHERPPASSPGASPSRLNYFSLDPCPNPSAWQHWGRIPHTLISNPSYDLPNRKNICLSFLGYDHGDLLGVRWPGLGVRDSVQCTVSGRTLFIDNSKHLLI
jgi:hypothetical protein